MTVRSTSSRAWRFELAATSTQGASGRCVRSSISWMARSYSGHFFRLRQSSGPIL